MASHTASQRYLSTRGGSYGLSFEEAVLKGLAPDNGLFIPEEIPSLPPNWQNDWANLPFEGLAFEVLSLYISPTEIPPSSLMNIIHKSYSTFRVPSVTPTVTLDSDRKIHLLELFHGPTFAFKDVALQLLGNLFEFFLIRRNQNKSKTGEDREHLTVIGATSGDTGSAAIFGLRGKKDISVFIMYPTGRISQMQEAQMTTVTDKNVHCLSVDGTFDDCQDLLKDLFADPLINTTQRLTSVNSINVSRILAQIIYYFASYFSLIRSGTFNPLTDHIRFVVPSGNFGNILAGFFAKRMGLPISKLIIATNENDILHRFWQTGAYEKHGVQSASAEGFNVGVKETLSPAMDILISSNFERLLWFIAYDVYTSNVDGIQERRQIAALKVKEWQTSLKTKGGFCVEQKVLDAARVDFSSERVSDAETLVTIRDVYRWPNTGSPGPKGYVLDPHSAISATAAQRSAKTAPGIHNVALSTAHPAKFSHAVEMALAEEKEFQFKDILPSQLLGLESLPRRVKHVQRSGGLDGVRTIIMNELEKELNGTP
ncbi:hypothetical protein Egran_04571 [Elaphomyces granulatus]|uniref:threonine synthase n=1 Tax=Elaphomyces granulatus TaxID=519963 RepID=A0A232LUA4_9EURO|nr:hypothetical protein Egran_04571 [Elaphomyces granulatus]